MKVSGTISFAKRASLFSDHWYAGDSIVEITIEEEVCYYLTKVRPKAFHHRGKIVLYSKKRTLIREWHFQSRIFSSLLFFYQGDETEYYKIGIFGTRNFIKNGEKVPTYLDIENDKRTFCYGEMEFSHRDFESICHFSAPSEKLQQALLMAYLIFNIPVQSE